MNPVLREALAGTASLLEDFAAKAKEPPGDGYRERTIEVAVWDQCDAGGESVDAFDFDDGEAEAIAAMIRAALADVSQPITGAHVYHDALRQARLAVRYADGTEEDRPATKLEEALCAHGAMAVALRRLMKEAAAVMALAEPQIRHACGHTNFACLQNAVTEAAAVLGSSDRRRDG